MWLYGTHAVLAALANDGRMVHRVIATPEAASSAAPRLAAAAAARGGTLPATEVMPREQLDRVLPRGAVHQGIGALVAPLPERDLADLLAANAQRHDLRVVVLDQVTDPHNIGAILRSAAAFDVAAVVMPQRHAPGAGGALAKSASGALESVPLIRVVNLARAMAELREASVWCVGLAGDAPTAIDAADLSGRIALVLGAEGEGLRRLTRENCDHLVRIPIARNSESLNVSNATAVALYEIARRARRSDA
jgi:23S rRNA (guanosine2251-2'-O)-methyltransferase